MQHSYDATSNIVDRILEGFHVGFAIHYFNELIPSIFSNCSMTIVLLNETNCYFTIIKSVMVVQTDVVRPAPHKSFRILKVVSDVLHKFSRLQIEPLRLWKNMMMVESLLLENIRRISKPLSSTVCL